MNSFRIPIKNSNSNQKMKKGLSSGHTKTKAVNLDFQYNTKPLLVSHLFHPKPLPPPVLTPAIPLDPAATTSVSELTSLTNQHMSLILNQITKIQNPPPKALIKPQDQDSIQSAFEETSKELKVLNY